MQPILNEPTEKELARIKEIQQRIQSGGNVQEMIIEVRTEYLKQQATQ